ncbi:ribosome hibernation-promoting factor, HPF/YfiA family [Arcanobacterium hippocoleae]|uniref:ribosome hibernation-promoting factor, HPF/YfiA family n=1 Tax=Arcanobacterium hippocoleae TaxID=149017 RepID=UPI003342D6A8
MEFVVKGRNAEISESFREHVTEKLSKIELFAPRAQRVEVEVTHEPNPAQAEFSEKIEITLRDRGPVVRAEAKSADRLSALDLAAEKLIEQLRRANERRKDHHRRGAKIDSGEMELDFEALFSSLTPQKETEVVVEESEAVPTKPGEATETQLGDSPVVVRQKLYEAKPMTVDQALYEMELVGHPFYLFIDAQTNQPCAAYRRHGWTYGVIRLDAKTSEFGRGVE